MPIKCQAAALPMPADLPDPLDARPGRDLSTRQLRAFEDLARERHFTRAAAACHLSQPAFSALIRQLEEAVGLDRKSVV